jgi:putative transposase
MKCVEIREKMHGLWRAADDSGAVLDLFLHVRRETQVVMPFFQWLLVNDDVPDVIQTDNLRCSPTAIRGLPVLHSVAHVQVISTARCNQLIEHSHRPTRQQRRSRIGSKPYAGPGIPALCMLAF